MRALAFLVAAAAIASAPSARADDAAPIRRGVSGIVERGGFIFGIENVFGYAVETTFGTTTNHFGFGPGTAAPHFAFTAVTTSGFTITGAFAMVQLRSKGHARGGTVVMGPRVGYLAMSRHGIGFWPQLGVTARLPLQVGGRDPFLTVGLHLPLVIGLTEHSALMIGPTIEQPFGGSRYELAALNVGLLGVF